MGKSNRADGYRFRLYDDNGRPKHEETFSSPDDARVAAHSFATDGGTKHRYGTKTGKYIVVVEHRGVDGEWGTTSEHPITPIQTRRTK
jgi:hypothetical protein